MEIDTYADEERCGKCSRGSAAGENGSATVTGRPSPRFRRGSWHCRGPGRCLRAEDLLLPGRGDSVSSREELEPSKRVVGVGQRRASVFAQPGIDKRKLGAYPLVGSRRHDIAKRHYRTFIGRQVKRLKSHRRAPSPSAYASLRE
jgi:hypothetical protein